MKPSKNFCKIFDLEKGQILIVKEYDVDDEKNTIRVTSCFEEGDCSVGPSMILGYASCKHRDESFLKFDANMAQNIFDDFEKLLGN